MVPEVDDVGREVGEDVDLDVGVNFAVGTVVATESMGAGSTITAGVLDDGAAPAIAADTAGVGMVIDALVAGGCESAIDEDVCRFVKTNTVHAATRATPPRNAKSIERFRGGSWVCVTPPTVAPRISSFDRGRPLRTEIGPCEDGVPGEDKVMAALL